MLSLLSAWKALQSRIHVLWFILQIERERERATCIQFIVNQYFTNWRSPPSLWLPQMTNDVALWGHLYMRRIVEDSRFFRKRKYFFVLNSKYHAIFETLSVSRARLPFGLENCLFLSQEPRFMDPSVIEEAINEPKIPLTRKRDINWNEKSFITCFCLPSKLDCPLFN